MTVTASGLVLYAGALLILFVTPGPVWVALLARSLSGGFAAAWPLAVGVALGVALGVAVSVCVGVGVKVGVGVGMFNFRITGK